MTFLIALWRIFLHSSNVATLEAFRAWTAYLRSCHSISVRFRSGFWLGHCKVFILFLLRPECASARGQEQMARRSLSGFVGGQKNSWVNNSLTLFQTITLPPPCFTAGTVWCNVTHTFQKSSTFTLSVHRPLSQMFCLLSSGFWPYTVPVSISWWSHAHRPELRPVRPAALWKLLSALLWALGWVMTLLLGSFWLVGHVFT